MDVFLQALGAGANGALVVFAWVLLRHELRLTRIESKMEDHDHG